MNKLSGPYQNQRSSIKFQNIYKYIPPLKIDGILERQNFNYMIYYIKQLLFWFYINVKKPDVKTGSWYRNILDYGPFICKYTNKSNISFFLKHIHCQHFNKLAIIKTSKLIDNNLRNRVIGNATLSTKHCTFTGTLFK